MNSIDPTEILSILQQIESSKQTALGLISSATRAAEEAETQANSAYRRATEARNAVSELESQMGQLDNELARIKRLAESLDH